jgi:HEAT repeat protein
MRQTARGAAADAERYASSKGFSGMSVFDRKADESEELESRPDTSQRCGMRWTPASGAARLRVEFPEILSLLCRILTGDVSSRELAADPSMIPILHGIGGNTALNLLRDASGRRLSHWPRAWAARTLAIIGDTDCSSAIESAVRDKEWRVRMQAVRAAGLVAHSATVDRMAEGLASDSHRRVREAVALSVGRNGSDVCVGLLRELSQDVEMSVRRAAERAISKLEPRTGG